MKYCAGVRMQYIAYIFGIAAMASLFMLYQQKTRARLLVCKLIADCCWALYYLYLGAYGRHDPQPCRHLTRIGIFLPRQKEMGRQSDNPGDVYLHELGVGNIDL